MRFTTIFFDLDDTLYPASSNLWPTLKVRMSLYMRDRMGIPEQDIARLREQYFREYGTTLRGLQANYSIDTADFLAFVHNVPLRDYLTPNKTQRRIIASLRTRNLIFTNADSAHAKRVLTELKLDDLFQTIIDINALAPYCKPMPESFGIALKLAGDLDPQSCVMIDDMPHTTRAAREAGMFSILFGRDGIADADASFTDWRELPEILDHE